LFTIGLEFSVKRMIKIRREVMLGGGLQIALTVFFVWIFATLFGLSIQVAILLGFIVSLSSSAIVLKLLVDRVEVHSSHGNLSVGILLFQDISMVLMVLLVQGFGEGSGTDLMPILKKLGIAVAAMAVIVVTVAYIVPKVFHEVVKLRNREVFMLTIVLVCLGTAWVTSLFGISLALGAFIAGLVISESEYSNQIVAEVLPFRDTFSSLFFISIGMLLEINYIVDNFVQVLSLTAIIIVAKAAIVVGVGQILRYPLRLSIIVGLNLAQIGEFSFILIKMGEGYNFLSHDLYQSILVVSVLTMAITPFLFQYSPAIAGIIGRRFGARFVMNTSMPRTTLSEHVIVVGYGLNGQNLAKVLKETSIEHLVMEVNYNRVKAARKDGHTAHFGDSSHPEILKRMGIEHAKLIVVGITDVLCTRRTVKAARDLNSNVTIVVRTRYINEVEELYQLGANQVIPEEFETSVEVFARVLKEYNIPGNIIQNQIDLVRQEGYAMFRNQSLSSDRLASLSSI
ncbi:MAG: cation:proton antiporter, partial [Deltaproteobacteria bacterium]|nr:cation:proton antiporter [Deltaproteobacteria bacterium]